MRRDEYLQLVNNPIIDQKTNLTKINKENLRGFQIHMSSHEKSDIKLLHQNSYLRDVAQRKDSAHISINAKCSFVSKCNVLYRIACEKKPNTDDQHITFNVTKKNQHEHASQGKPRPIRDVERLQQAAIIETQFRGSANDAHLNLVAEADEVDEVDSNHWVSFVVNLKKAQFSVVCPYGLKGRTKIQSDFYSVRFESWCEYYNSRRDCEPKQWEMIHYPHDHQNQKDGFNCGVFCSFYIEEIVKSNGIEQQPKNLGLFRKKMASILTSNSSI
jgi:hypothetical protein